MKHLQKGSTEVVIIVSVVILVLGAVGYVFWNNYIRKDETKSSVSTSDSAAKKQVNKTAQWFVYETKIFKLPIPDGWKLARIDGDGVDILTEDEKEQMAGVGSALQYSEGTHASIVPKQLEGREPVTHFYLKSGTTQPETPVGSLLAAGYTKEQPIITKQGLKIDKYVKTYTQPSASYVAGSKVYAYEARYEQGGGSLTYQVDPGQSDNVVQLEEALRNLTIKSNSL